MTANGSTSIVNQDSTKATRTKSSSPFPQLNENEKAFMRIVVEDPMFNFAFGLGTIARQKTNDDLSEFVTMKVTPQATRVSEQTDEKKEIAQNKHTAPLDEHVFRIGDSSYVYGDDIVKEALTNRDDIDKSRVAKDEAARPVAIPLSDAEIEAIEAKVKAAYENTTHKKKNNNMSNAPKNINQPEQGAENKNDTINDDKYTENESENENENADFNYNEAYNGHDDDDEYWNEHNDNDYDPYGEDDEEIGEVEEDYDDDYTANYNHDGDDDDDFNNNAEDEYNEDEMFWNEGDEYNAFHQYLQDQDEELQNESVHFSNTVYDDEDWDKDIDDQLRNLHTQSADLYAYTFNQSAAVSELGQQVEDLTVDNHHNGNSNSNNDIEHQLSTHPPHHNHNSFHHQQQLNYDHSHDHQSHNHHQNHQNHQSHHHHHHINDDYGAYNITDFYNEKDFELVYFNREANNSDAGNSANHLQYQNGMTIEEMAKYMIESSNTNCNKKAQYIETIDLT